jgi:hypothetical protein
MPMRSFGRRVRDFCSSDKTSRGAVDRTSFGLDDEDLSNLTRGPSFEWSEDEAEPLVRYEFEAQDSASGSKESKTNHSQSVCDTIPERQPDTTVDGKLLPVPSLSVYQQDKKVHRPFRLKSQMSKDRIAVEKQPSQDHSVSAKIPPQPQTVSPRNDSQQMQSQTRS